MVTLHKIIISMNTYDSTFNPLNATVLLHCSTTLHIKNYIPFLFLFCIKHFHKITQSIYTHFGITSLELNMAPGVLLEPYMSQGGQGVAEIPIVSKGLSYLTFTMFTVQIEMPFRDQVQRIVPIPIADLLYVRLQQTLMTSLMSSSWHFTKNVTVTFYRKPSQLPYIRSLGSHEAMITLSLWCEGKLQLLFPEK